MTQHVYPPNDLLPHVTNGDYCPCEPRIEGDLVIHNSWDGRELQEVGVDWCCPKIQVFADGDQWCALAGKDIQIGYAAFGASPHLALANLINGYRQVPLDTEEDAWKALEAEEITMSRAAEFLGMSFMEVRLEFNRRMGHKAP